MQSMDAVEGGAHGDAASTIAAFEKEELAREQLQMVKARTMCMSSPLLSPLIESDRQLLRSQLN